MYRVKNEAVAVSYTLFSFLKQWTTKYPNILGVLALIVTLILFWPTIGHFFAIDDFSWLYYAGHNIDTFAEWVQAFTRLNGSGQYRPLSQQVFFWIGYRIFGLNPLGLHLINFSVFLLACWFIYKFLLKIAKSRVIAASVVSIFCFSSVHIEHLFWVSAFTETLATLAVAGGLYAVVSGKKWQIAMWYVVGLCANETAIITPLLVSGYLFIYKKESIKESLLRYRVTWYILGVYLLLRTLVFGGLGAKGVFAIVWSPIVWLKEINHEFLNAFGFNPSMSNVLHESSFLKYFVIFLVIGLFSLIVYRVAQYKKTHASWRLVLLGVYVFVAALLPVLPFANNFASYTTSIATIGLAILLIGLIGTSGWIRIIYPIVGLSVLLLSAINMYGPNGLYYVDGYRALSKASYSAFIHMENAYQNAKQPLTVSIVGEGSLRVTPGLDELAALIGQDSKVITCYSRDTNLILIYDQKTSTFESLDRHAIVQMKTYPHC